LRGRRTDAKGLDVTDIGWLILCPTLVTMVAAILAFFHAREAAAISAENRARIDELNARLTAARIVDMEERAAADLVQVDNTNALDVNTAAADRNTAAIDAQRPLS
jgi:hypothetical protein